MDDAAIISLIKSYAQPFTKTNGDFDALIDSIGDAQLVLLGEATHGTDEFYHIRSLITQQLITKKGFNAIALEADWPDTYRINRYIHDQKTDSNSMHALDGFKRFPQWMWRNNRMIDLIGWLYHYNKKRSEQNKISIFGLDLYSLFASIHEVIMYLDKIDPTAAQRARNRYNCFEQYQHNIQHYGYALTFDVSASCQQNVIDQLKDLRINEFELLGRNGKTAYNEFFNAKRNATLIKNAETYYRSLFFGSPETSWNIRDTHMMETVQALLDHLSKTMPTPKIIIWAHNSHIGNAQATQMGQQGEINLGQLAKEKYGNKAQLIGFTTYSGTVSAASQWDGPVERKQIVPALPTSYEALFHQTHIPHFILSLKDHPNISAALEQERLERAIGVIYQPQTERQSHYFKAALSKQFDVIIHSDQTNALEPLEKSPEWENSEFSETYPTGY